MARRYFISDIVGAGTKLDPYRAKVQGAGRHHSSVIPVDLVTGIPLFSHCLAIVAAADLSPVVSLTGVDAMPDFSLDTLLSTLTNQQRNQLLNRLQARGLPIVNGDLTGSSTFRTLLRKIGQHYQANFLETDINVPDIA